MKKFSYLILSITLLSACNQTEKENANITLSGTIENATGNKIRLKNSELDTTFTFEGNSFSFNFQNEKPSYYNFIIDDDATSIYLKNGDSLEVSIDLDEFDESVKYSGNASKVNQYLADLFILNETLPSGKPLYASSEADFLLKLDTLYNAKLKLIKDNVAVLNDEVFFNYEMAIIKYGKLLFLSNFKSYHRYYAAEPDFELSETFNDNIKNYDLNDASLLAVAAYKNFLNAHLGKLVNKRMKNDTITYDSSNESGYVQANLDQMSETFTNQEVKSILMHGFLSGYMTFISQGKFEKYLATFNKINTNAKNGAKLNADFDKWRQLAKGKPAPNFNYATVTEDTLSMDDFIGKYVYIDVWATWCGPCLQELPHLEKLQEEFKDKNVTFMSISIDNTPEPWKKMVEEKEMKGVQLYADGAWKSTLVKDYMINGIPRFILVDRAGKLISASTERPSGGIKEILEGLEGI